MKTVFLKDICEIIAGQSPPSSTYNQSGEGLPFFQGKADFGELYPKTRIWCNKPQKVAESGDILISVRAPVGPTNICNQRACIGRGLSAIRSGDSIDNKYLLYFLRKHEQEIADWGNGSTFSAITQEDIKRIRIPLPSLEEQGHIVKILDQVDALRQKRSQVIELLDEHLRSKFLEMFGDPVTNPSGWDTKELKEITCKLGSGATPRGGKASYLSSGISLIRSLNVHDNEFVYKDLAFLNDQQAEALSNVEVQENDLLLNITGASVCRCAVVPKEVLPARVNQHVSIIRPNELVNPWYLLSLLISKSFKRELLKDASAGGATREALTKQQIEKLRIICPPLELQNRFSKIAEKSEAVRQTMLAQSEELESQFQALIQKAFKGQL